MMKFRAFAFLFEPTMQAVTPDGTVLWTTPTALHLMRFTPVPAYVPASEGYAMVSRDEGLEWRTVGDFDDGLRPVYDGDRLALRRTGEHMPEAARVEIQAWCNAYAEAHPSTPLIGRTEVAYQRNSYTTTHTCLFSYNQLREFTDDCIRKYDRGSRARAAATQQRLD